MGVDSLEEVFDIEPYLNMVTKKGLKYFELLNCDHIKGKKDDTILKLDTNLGKAIVFTWEIPAFYRKYSNVKVDAKRILIKILDPLDIVENSTENVTKYLADHILFQSLWKIDVNKIRKFLPTILKILEIADLESQQITLYGAPMFWEVDEVNIDRVVRGNYYCLVTGKKLKQGFFLDSKSYKSFIHGNSRSIQGVLQYFINKKFHSSGLMLSNAQSVIDYIYDLSVRLEDGRSLGHLPRVSGMIKKVFADQAFQERLKNELIVPPEELGIGSRGVDAKRLKRALDDELSKQDQKYAHLTYMCQLDSICELLK